MADWDKQDKDEDGSWDDNNEAGDESDDSWGDDDENGWDDDFENAGDFGGELTGRGKVENEIVGADGIERQYKQAKTREDKSRLGREAIEQFRKCIEMEKTETPDSVEFSVQSASMIFQILCSLGEDGIVSAFRQFVELYRPNNEDFFKHLQSMLSAVDRTSNPQLRSEIYDETLQALETLSEFHWQEYATRFCKKYLNLGELGKVTELLTVMHDKCRLPNGEDDPQKGGQLLKIYAIQIQVATAAGDDFGLNDLFKKTETLTTAISDSEAMSVIKECYGKMFGNRNQWERAYNEFYAAFSNAINSITSDGAGRCLNYVILSSMLSITSVNPFASQEASSMKDAAEVAIMAQLLSAFEGNDVVRFEKILARNEKKIQSDQFLNTHMQAVLQKLRASVLVKLIKPYQRVQLNWLGNQLNILDSNEIEQLAVKCILDGSVKGRLDQIHGILDLKFGVTKADNLYTAVDQWMQSVKKLQNNLASKSSQGGGRFGGWGGDFDDEDFPLFASDMFAYDGYGW